LAREVVRLVQEARKNSGFEVSDRIELRWAAGGDTAEALREHQGLVADEVLAVRVEEVDPTTLTGAAVRDEALDLTFTVTRAT
ncbi:MAG TPA: DUF5915 domain-containing protein, partial [Nocardioides sp.]|nr:DUF5915 domain-containing protein [Nocardioides sp.]